MKKSANIYVAGGATLIGQALRVELKRQGHENILGHPGEEPDLTNAVQVDDFFSRTIPDYVFLAAGKSGGIQANQKYPAELMRDNLLAECHVLHSAYTHRVKKLLYLASSCCYPKECPQPMMEDSLLTGLLEPTNEAYAVAKIAGIKLCQAYRRQYGANFICGIPANVFGPGDDFSPEDSHVIAALLRRMHEAKIQGAEFVEVWGTGFPRREFIYVKDLAEACLWVMERYNGAQPINLGCGTDMSVKELALLVKEITGFPGRIFFDPSKPDGMPRKILDSSRLQALQWQPRVPLRMALQATYQGFLEANGFAGVAAVPNSTAAGRRG